MGGGQYSFDVAREARSHQRRGPRGQGFGMAAYLEGGGPSRTETGDPSVETRALDPLLNVFGQARECQNDECIVVAMDVTRSRGEDARLVYERLPQLIGWLELRGYLPGAAISLAAVGDATVDRAPVQISQWERDNRLDEALARFWLEEGGGGTGEESYELVAYYYARHTRIRINGQGRKGYFFFVGDEAYYPKVKREEVERVLGQQIPEDIPAHQIFRELRQKFHVFFIYPKTSMQERRADIDAEIEQRVRAAGGQYDNVDVRISLLWNTRDDLDLHVLTPSGEEIWYNNKASRCGGVLDVDRNVRGETLKPVENVRWAKGRAHKGTYSVMVQTYRFHEKAQRPVDFRVEVEAGGQVTHYTGVMSPKGETGRDSDQLVVSFDFDPSRVPAEPPAMARHRRYANYDDAVIRNAWDEVLEEGHLLGIEDPQDIIEVMVGAIGLTEQKTDLEGYLSALDSASQEDGAVRGRCGPVGQSLGKLAAAALPVAGFSLDDLPAPG